MDSPAAGEQENEAQTTFQYSLGMHVICIVGFVFATACIPFLLQQSVISRGMTAPGLAFCVVYLVFVFWVYFWIGRNTFAISDDGLTISGPMVTKTIPWSAIVDMRWNAALHVITLHSKERRLVVLSTDYLPELRTLITEVWQRSNCEIGHNMREVLTSQEPLPNNRWPQSMS